MKDTVENGSNGISDVGGTQQGKEGVNHGLHPRALILEEDVAGGLLLAHALVSACGWTLAACVLAVEANRSIVPVKVLW